MKTAGLDTEGSGGVAADAGSTVFTAVIDGVTVVSRFAGGGGPGPVNHGGGAPGDSGAPGAAAMALLAQLADPSVAWGGSSGNAIPYAARAYRVWTAPAAADAGTGGAPIAWPLSTGPTDFGSPAAADLGVTGLRSGIVIGKDATTLAGSLASAAPGTLVTAGGKTWQVWVRVVFPDELGS